MMTNHVHLLCTPQGDDGISERKGKGPRKGTGKYGKDPFIGALMVEYLKKYGSDIKQHHLTVGSLDEVMPALQKAKMEKRVKLEAPFQVYTINADKIAAATGQEDLSAAIVPLDEWLVPVKIHNNNVALLTVGQIEGKWQVVGSSLGDFGKRMEQVPSDCSPQKKRGKYVRVNSAYVDFIVTEDKEEPKVFLFPYGESQLNMENNRKDRNGLYAAEDVLPIVAHQILSRKNY